LSSSKMVLRSSIFAPAKLDALYTSIESLDACSRAYVSSFAACSSLALPIA
jgi:hypothetical protein